MAIVREPDATWVIPTEDEWYKAAYHKNDPSAPGGNYWDYPTDSDSTPGYVNDNGDLSGTGTPFTEGGIDPGNYATYDGDGGTDGIGSPYYTTQVGEWENSASPYGTFDQGGNISEWNETEVRSNRGVGGASFLWTAYGLRPSLRTYANPSWESFAHGFRVARIPEPATMVMLVLVGVGVLRRRRA